jgi:hypothetical protein
MNATGVTFSPDQTGCQHKYREKSFFKINGIPAAKCSTCGHVIAWSSLGTPAELRWIAGESKFAAELASNSAPNIDQLVALTPFRSADEQRASI